MAELEGIDRSLHLPPLPTDIPNISKDAATNRLAQAWLRSLLAALETQQRAMEAGYDRLVKRVNEMILSGTTAQRPPAGVQNRIYYNTTTGTIQFDTGSSWV